MIWHRLREWWDRRLTLGELRKRQRQEEALLAENSLNPLHLAKLSLDTGDFERAASRWDQARALLPATVLRSRDSLDILLALKRYDEAESLMAQGCKEFPRDQFYLLGLARIADQRDQPGEALTLWQRARDHTRYKPEGYVGVAQCLVTLGRLDEAEAQFDAAIECDPEKLHGWLGRARVSDQRGDWNESLVRWKLLADRFRFEPGFAGHARALSELGRLDEAEAYLRESVLIFPRNLEIAVSRAHVARRGGDLATACDRWAVVRAIAPYFPPAYREGAHCLTAAERHAEAEALLLAASERFHDQGWPLLDFARLAHDRHDWREAAARWEALRRRFPDEAAGYSQGADALQALGRDEAAAALRRGA